MSKIKLKRKDRLIINKALRLYGLQWQSHVYEPGEERRIKKLRKNIR